MVEERKGALEAEELLEDLGFDTLPITPNQVAASIDCDQFRLVLEEKIFTSDGILGKAEGNNKGALIYVNANITDKRRLNFTAAHEIGHVCMHIMQQKKMSFECGAKELYNPYNDPIEKEANGFASGLLMPRRLISANFNGDILGGGAGLDHVAAGALDRGQLVFRVDTLFHLSILQKP